MKLSILVCTLPERLAYMSRLTEQLEPQMRNNPVELLTDASPRPVPIGRKRNALLKRATGDYVAFVDDDDRVSTFYVNRIIDAIKHRPDCVGINGFIQFDGKNGKRFIHTRTCNEWCEKQGVYWRYPNHLNPIRRELALQAGFPDDSNFGEDKAFSDRVKPLLKTEVMIDEIIYWYDYRATKTELKP